MINVGVNILNNPKGAGVGPPPGPKGGPPTHNRGRRKGSVNRSNEPSRLLLLIDSKHLIMLFNWDFHFGRINYFLFSASSALHHAEIDLILLILRPDFFFLVNSSEKFFKYNFLYLVSYIQFLKKKLH